jgi:tetratricopeptide (TPR) repeat protein
MGLLLCTKKAKAPYTLPQSDKKVYSIEELCYYLYNNSYMITEDFFCKELADFIEIDLGLPSVSSKIKRGIDFKENLTSMVMYIMDACAYYSQEEKAQYIKSLESISSKSPAQRVKARADMLLNNRKYTSAITAYSIILEKKEISQEKDYYSDIVNNIGIAYVNMFEYEEAIRYFKMAYNLYNKEDYMDNLLCAAILNDNDQCTNDIIAEFAINEETMDKYKRVIEYQTKQIAKSKRYRMVQDKVTLDTGKSIDVYEKQVKEILFGLKEEYKRQLG